MSKMAGGELGEERQGGVLEREQSHYVDCYTGAFGIGTPFGLDAYTEVIAPSFDYALAEGVTPEAFHARTRVVFLPDVTVSYAAGSASRFNRSARTIAAQGTDQILVICYCSGYFDLEIGGETHRVEAGDLAFIDLEQEVTIHSFGVETLSLALNRTVLADSLGQRGSLHGYTRRADAVTRLFESMVETVIATGPTILRIDAEQVSALMVQLVRSVLRGVRDVGPGPGPVSRAMVERYIDDHLLDAGLGVGQLCAAFGLGRSSLYRLFKGAGGVAGAIQRRRLLYAYSALRRGGVARVSQLAHRLGYGAAGFSRAFRDFYGVSPREVLASGGRGLGDGESTAVPLLVSRVPLGYLELVRG